MMFAVSNCVSDWIDMCCLEWQKTRRSPIILGELVLINSPISFERSLVYG